MTVDPAVFYRVHEAAESATTERRQAKTLTAEAVVETMTLAQLRAAVTALVGIASATGSQVIGEDVSASDFQTNLDLLVDEGLRGTGLPSVSTGDHTDYWAAAHGDPADTESEGVELSDDAVIFAAARTLINELTPAFDPETGVLDLHDMARRAGVTIAECRHANNVLQTSPDGIEIQLGGSQGSRHDRAIIAAALGVLFLEHLPSAERKGGSWKASYPVMLCPVPTRPWQCVFAHALLMPEAAFRAAIETTTVPKRLATIFGTAPEAVIQRAEALGLDLNA